MPRLARLALLFAVALFAAGCGFTKPTLSFKNVRLRETDLEGTTIDVIYRIKNPNPIGISLAEVSYAFEVEGHPVVSGKPPNGMRIPQKGEADLVFPAKVIFGQIAPVIQVFLTQDTARYRASGSIGISTPIGVLRFPLSYENTFPVPKIPRFSFAKPRVEGLSFNGARVVIPLTMTNSNAFPIPLGGFSASIAIANANVGQASAAMPPLLAAGESRMVELPINVDFFQAGMAVANAIRGGAADVRVDGALRAGGLSLPIRLQQNLSFR